MEGEGSTHFLQLPVSGENSGKIVSLMTSDTELIGNTLPTFIFAISTPIQMAIVLYLLYQQIGVLSFVSVGLLILIMPIAAVFGIKVIFLLF
jgi:hypothetical protein